MSWVQKLCLIGGIAFILNLGWEVAHSVLYVHYRGNPIVFSTLLYAATIDGLLIMACAWCAQLFRTRQTLVFVCLSIAIAFGIEWWALETGRWAYTDAMPLVPLLHIGVSPFVQLAITGSIARWLARA